MLTIPLTERITRARREQNAADRRGDASQYEFWTRRMNLLLDAWTTEHATKEPA